MLDDVVSRMRQGPPALPRGTMEIFVTGSYSGIRAPTMACPAEQKGR